MKTERSMHVLAMALINISLLLPLYAWAQEKVQVLEEVIVTAQKRETNLQTTAAAISAYSSDMLRERSISNIADLGRANPSMDISLYQGEAQIYIRGIGYSGIIGGTDSSTALHLDGVYVSRSSSAVAGFMDLERIELVRGPQGTLYGRNATSGSVNLIHKRPTEDFAAETTVTLGNYESYKVFGVVSGPLSDKLRARLAVQVDNHEGYTDLTRVDGSTDKAESKDDLALRLTLEYEASDSLLFSLSADYYKADDSQVVWLLRDKGTGTNPFFRQRIEVV